MKQIELMRLLLEQDAEGKEDRCSHCYPSQDLKGKWYCYKRGNIESQKDVVCSQPCSLQDWKKCPFNWKAK